jgi:glucokinase
MLLKTKEPTMILAGDIGGTKSWLSLSCVEQKQCRLSVEKTFHSKDYPSLETILREFLRGQEKIASACFGVPGPVVGGIVKTTNLPWVIDTQSIQKELSIRNVEIINDLVANAYGIFTLKKRDLVTLNAGKIKKGNVALLSAGTGLGEAILFWNGKQHVPSPSEGGHIEFGPKNNLEIELSQYLLDRFGHVSYERVLSGAGLLQIYQFLKDSKRFGREPAWLSRKMEQDNPAAVISEMAQQKRNRLCRTALDMFVSIYGAAAGNLALQVMAVGGIYIGGGIAPKIIWKLKGRTFMNAFKNKGRLSDVVAHIPVKVIMNDKTALLGAAYHAMGLLYEG